MTPPLAILPTALQQTSQGVLGSLGWVDITALAILAVFLILGLFRGFLWQLSRIVTIVLGIHLAGRFSDDLEPHIASWFGKDAVASGMPHYVSYFLIFLGVLIALSLVAWLLEKLIKKTGMSFYDRVGGGLLGVGTGATAVLALLIAVFCLFPTDGTVVKAAEGSKTLEWSKLTLQKAQGLLPAKWIPDGVRARFGLPTDNEILEILSSERAKELEKGKPK